MTVKNKLWFGQKQKLTAAGICLGDTTQKNKQVIIAYSDLIAENLGIYYDKD